MADQEQRTEDEHEGTASAGTALLDDEGTRPASPGIDEETRRRRAAAMAQIVQYGDPVLKSRASEISDFDEALMAEVDRMIGLMKDGLGVGLAANQVGRLKRLLVFQPNADSEPRALVNPEIEWVSEETEAMVEGCLSIPRVVVEVERPLHARVSGLDQAGEPVMIESSGYEARILQHEIDHLNGVLILDRTDRSERRAALKALRRGESYPPPPAEEEAETAA
jgi:peptide deformylase